MKFNQRCIGRGINAKHKIHENGQKLSNGYRSIREVRDPSGLAEIVLPLALLLWNSKVRLWVRAATGPIQKFVDVSVTPLAGHV